MLPSSIIYYILRSLMHVGEDPQTEKLGVLEGLSERCLPSVIQLLFQTRCWGCTPQVPSQPRPGKTVAWILKSMILWYNNKYLVFIPVLAPSFRNSCSCAGDQPCGSAFVMLIWKSPGSLKGGGRGWLPEEPTMWLKGCRFQSLPPRISAGDWVQSQQPVISSVRSM